MHGMQAAREDLHFGLELLHVARVLCVRRRDRRGSLAQGGLAGSKK